MTTILTQRDFIAPLVSKNLDWKGPIAGYIDGPFAWDKEDWGKFSGHKVRISGDANPCATVFDFENGNAPLNKILEAIDIRWNYGESSVVYLNRSTYQRYKRQFAGRPVSFWGADWLIGKLPDVQEMPFDDWCGWQIASYPDYDLSYIDIERWPDWH